MTKQDRMKVADALRSGEFTRGVFEHYNARSDSYCATGVAYVALTGRPVLDLCKMTAEASGLAIRQLTDTLSGLGMSHPLRRDIEWANDMLQWDFQQMADVFAKDELWDGFPAVIAKERDRKLQESVDALAEMRKKVEKTWS